MPSQVSIQRNLRAPMAKYSLINLPQYFTMTLAIMSRWSGVEPLHTSLFCDVIISVTSRVKIILTTFLGCYESQLTAETAGLF